MLLARLREIASSPATSAGDDGDQRASKLRVVFGTALLSTANIVKLSLQCVLIPVLARLLGPGAFGLMSVAMSFVLLANMLSDGGMGSALVRERRADQDLESTVFWLSTLIGFGLAAIVAVAAWPVSILYRQPELFPILLVLAPILIVSSILSVPNARIVRVQRLDVFAAGDVGSALVAAATGVILALKGFGVWSLVLQQLAFWAIKACWICSFSHFRPRFTLHLRRARPLLRFSANNLAANIADFASKNAPIMIVGGVLSVAAVARYSMAYQLTRVAETVVSDPVNLAAFSGTAASPSRQDAADFAVVSLRILMLVLAPLFCGLALTADLLAPIVLGHRWTGTGSALAALAPGAFLLCLYRFATAVLLGRGRSGRVLKLTLLTGAATSLGTIFGVRHGVTWAICGLSLGGLAVAPLYARSLAQTMRLSFSTLMSAVSTSILAVLSMAMTVLLLRFELGTFAPAIQLAASILGGAVAYSVTAFFWGGKQVHKDIMRLRHGTTTPLRTEPVDWPFLPGHPVEEGPAPVEVGLSQQA